MYKKKIHFCLIILVTICSFIQATRVFRLRSQFKDIEESILALAKCQFHRNINGTGNNIMNPNLAAAGSIFRRLAPTSYEDAYDKPITSRPHPRTISNVVGAQPSGPIIPNSINTTQLFTIWGQFLDHDLGLGQPPKNQPVQKMDIIIPAGDPFFISQTVIPFSRNEHKLFTPRQQINQLTSWVDGSQIYGSSQQVSDSLRTFKDGKLKTSGEDLLSRDQSGVRFKHGDIRVNENLALLTLHTLWNREHNRLCDQILKLDDGLSDEEVFQIARSFVIGLLQKITYQEWLPLLLGPAAWKKFIGKYKGYDPSRDARIPNQFSHAAFRIGHTFLVTNYPQINSFGNVIENLTLRTMFERADLMNSERMNRMLRGLSTISNKQKSRSIVDDVRNFLVLGGKNQIKLDLYALNIQRGRDHGLLDYNSLRNNLGLENYQRFQDITNDTDTVSRLKSVYVNLRNVDPWVGILCETDNYKGMMGQLGSTIVGITFRDLRDGDRFWYENYMSDEVIAQIKSTTIADVILRNTDIDRLPNEGSAFMMPGAD